MARAVQTAPITDHKNYDQLSATSGDRSSSNSTGIGEPSPSPSSSSQESKSPSWFDSVINLSRRIILGSPPSSPSTKSVPSEISPPEPAFETELKVVGDSDWIVIEHSSSSAEDSPDMSSSAVAHKESEHSHKKRSGTNKATKDQLSTPPLGPKTSSVSSKASKSTRPSSPHPTTEKNSTPSLQRKSSGRVSRSNNLEVTNGGASHRSLSPSPGKVRNSSPTRSSSGGGGGASSGNIRSSSPTRNASGGGSKVNSNSLRSGGRKKPPTQVNDRITPPVAQVSSGSDLQPSGSHDSTSQGGIGKVRSSSPSRGAAGHGSKTNSSNSNSLRSNSKKKTSHQTNGHEKSHGNVGSPQLDSRPGHHDNGTGPHVNGKVSTHLPPSGSGQVPVINGPSENGVKQADQDKEEEASTSAFEKVRDTLRISRPKKKKKGKLAYSIVVNPGELSTPEINLHDPNKYEDPFETSYAENGDPDQGKDHDFKPVSIPHNKPEYCDRCGDVAWGLYRQVLKCSRCNYTVHRKCEGKVQIGCSSRRLEQAILQHDKQVEDVERMAAREEIEKKEKEKDKMEVDPPSSAEPSGPSTALLPPSTSSTPTTPPVSSTSSDSTPSSMASSTPHSSISSSQLLTEKTKLSRKIREYNRKTTPVHHIHIKSTHQAVDPNTIEYHGFVRVHMNVQRPIHVSTAITRTSWYQLMRPVKERTQNDVDGYDIQTAFYLPMDTNRLVHIQNTTTTKELVQILLKKFCVTDNPKKFSLYEEYGGDCRRLFEEDRPLEISLDASVSHRNSKLVLRDNTYSTIQWDAFTAPELSNFIQILQREEELYIEKLTERFGVWKKCIEQTLKEKCMEEQAKKMRKTVNSKLSASRGRSTRKTSPKSSPKNSLKTTTTSTPTTSKKSTGKSSKS